MKSIFSAGLIPLAALAITIGLADSFAAQTVSVTPRKVVYRRPNPIMPEKRSFTVTYPRVSGVSASVRNKIQSAVDYEKTFGISFKEEIADIQWLTEVGYTVNFNSKGILSLTLKISGVGAYPSESERRISFETATGARISMEQEAQDSLDELLERLNGMLAAEVAKHKALYKDPEYGIEDPDVLFGELVGFTPDRVEQFSVSPEGITFHHNYGFPHVTQALEPPGLFFLPWSELRPYIRSSGAFRKFLKDK
jgi:predicted site-specific integrase-resolvase